jgi:hypothetical protein
VPLHDWTRLPDAQFHAFHLGWLWNLARALNGGALPPGNVARPEEYVGPFPANVLATARLVMVSSTRDERRVAVIEVVSPGNKDSLARAEFFHRKLVECLGAGLHLLIVDLHAGTAVAPGFSARVAKELSDAQGQVRQTGLEATSFERQADPIAIRIFQRELTVGAALPDVPLFLLRGAHVMVPLESTYVETVAALRAVDRERLA